MQRWRIMWNQRIRLGASRLLHPSPISFTRVNAFLVESLRETSDKSCNMKVNKTWSVEQVSMAWSQHLWSYSCRKIQSASEQQQLSETCCLLSLWVLQKYLKISYSNSGPFFFFFFQLKTCQLKGAALWDQPCYMNSHAAIYFSFSAQLPNLVFLATGIKNDFVSLTCL